MPKFMQHLFLFPNFDDLGTVFIRPVVDTIWVPRHLYLWDNNLFETIPNSDDTLPLGYANLSGGSIASKQDKKPSSELHSRTIFSSPAPPSLPPSLPPHLPRL
jgi:hypothetical protein